MTARGVEAADRRSVVLAALALALLAVRADAFQAAGAPRPAVAAHRGGALLWPENSRLAFRNALALGVEYLELDVHRSRDGEVVVIHDATLDRTTAGAGPVGDRTLDELRLLRLRDRHGSVTAETVPTLDEIAQMAAAAGRQLLVEIKVGPGGARYPGIEEAVLAALERHGLARSSVVMAFEPETWRRVRELGPGIRAGALLSARSLERSGVALPAALDSAIRAGIAFIGLHHALVTPAAVAQARQAGVVLGAWTVNEPEAMRRVIEHGVGIVISDRPDLARDLLAR